MQSCLYSAPVCLNEHAQNVSNVISFVMLSVLQSISHKQNWLFLKDFAVDFDNVTSDLHLVGTVTKTL